MDGHQKKKERKKERRKTVITERLGEGEMGRYCIDVRGKEKKKKTTSRIRYIYTVYVTKSLVILMNSIIIIV